MGDRAIRFYFDFISHNAYLAWTQIKPLAARFERDVKPVPVLFAGFLDAHGQMGPAEIQPKARWMTRNVLRKAAVLGVPIKPPYSHPFNPLLPLRVVSAPMGADEQLALIDALFDAVWVESRNVGDPDVVVEIIDRAGLDGEGLVGQSYEDDTKQTLRKETESAIALGAFGVPTMTVDGELFWGLDDLAFLEAFLDGSDPLPLEQWPDWEAVKPSVRRRRTAP
jgi:2-hydroxychromene-2-carboxylate isomerase